MEGNEEFELEMDLEGFDIADEIAVEEPVLEVEDTKEEKQEEPKDDNTFTVEFKKEGQTTEEETEEELDDEPDDVSAPIALVKSLAEAFTKDGVLSVEDEDIAAVKDLEGFKGLIAKTIKNNEYADLSSEAKEALEAIRAGVPVNTVVQNYNTELTLNSITEDDFVEADDDDDDTAAEKKSIREKLIYQDLLSKGYTEAVAKKKTEKAFVTGDDEEDAKLAATALLEKVKQKKAEDAQAAVNRQKDLEKEKDAFVNKITETKEIVEGLPLTEDVKNWLVKSMTTPTGRTKEGKLRTVVSDKRDEDPTGFNTKLHYYIKLGLFDKKPDTSVFTATKVSNATKELEKNLSMEGAYDGGKGFSLAGLSGKRKDAVDYSLLDNIKF